MKRLLFLVLLLSNFIGRAQYTTIPDVNFEKALIGLGIDSGTIDGKVLTSSINGIKDLSVDFLGITDLTGIEDFSSLIFLSCVANKLTSLDVSKNLALNTLLCFTNQITRLDISINMALTSLVCGNNQITSLDLSKNINLVALNCSNNKLVTLNLKNGNNINFATGLSNLKLNPSLACIQVDNKSYSDANWSGIKDAIAIYSENCSKTTAPITPPIITATGNQVYCAGTSLKIIQTISITNDPLEPDTDAIYVQISSGYVSGSDVLTLSNASSHPTIVSSWDATSGKLKLFSPTGGKILYTDFVAALKDVVFSNSSPSPSGARSFSITIGQANYLPSTQHYYQFIPSIGISWTDAKLAAESSNYYGLKGYLATILAADEAQLTGKQSSGAGWIGGSDAETEGVWKWVTGPEGLANAGTGIVFWNGLANGSTPNFAFWNTNEPNQFAGANEDYAHITAPGIGITGAWNDLTITGDANGSYQPKGYIVEYGGMPGDPILQISASTSITISTINITTTSGSCCDSGSVNLGANSSAGTINWYDSQTGGNLVGNGNLFSTPNIAIPTTYYVDASISGCTSSPRSAVTATIITTPSITASTPNTRCDSGTLSLGATASSGTINWYNSQTGGTFVGTGNSFTTPNISIDSFYYVDATFFGCTTAIRTPIKATNITTPSLITTPDARCDSGLVTLQAIASAGTINWYDVNAGGMVLGTGNSFTTPNILATTNFYADATQSGCTSPRTEAKATIYPIDKNNKEVVLCQTETATLDASIPGMNYLWSPGGEMSQTIDISSIGDYTVTISSPTIASCGSKKIFNVIEHPKAIINEIIIDENSIKIELSNPKEYYEFSIDGELFQKSNQFSYIASGNHTAFVRENNECNLVTQDFTIFTIAKYFTPNNDGINDTWLIPEMKDYPGSNVKIFDRYGKLLKQLNAGTIGWNGQFNGINLTADDYWYVLKLDSTQAEIKGHFALKR